MKYDMSATERLFEIERPVMKKPTVKEALFVTALVAITVTGGFGLYQDIQGDNHAGINSYLIERCAEKTNA